MVEAKFPTIELGSVADDRNFRVPIEPVIQAVQEVLRFTKMAG